MLISNYFKYSWVLRMALVSPHLHPVDIYLRK